MFKKKITHPDKAIKFILLCIIIFMYYDSNVVQNLYRILQLKGSLSVVFVIKVLCLGKKTITK